MSTYVADLLVRADRIVCKEAGLDGPGAVAVHQGRIVAAGPDVELAARQTVTLEPGDVLLPGFVDLHAHPDKRTANGSRYGIDPDRELLPRGTTTVLSQGDAGSSDWQAYKSSTIGLSRTRILVALNIGRYGEQGEGPALQDPRAVDADRCARAIGRDSGRIWGIAVNTSRAVTGDNDPREVLALALEAAEAVDVPLLFGSRREADVPLDEQLALLRPGDIVTYCFSGTPENLLDDATGEIRASVREARERGVIFDVGHGMQSFDWRIADAAIAQGFPPDTISTDQYRRHVGSEPPHDMARTLSKLIAAGMPELDAFHAATWRPADVLGVTSEVGTLRVGGIGDLVAIRRQPDGRLADTQGVARAGGCWEPVFVALAGDVIVGG
jgi:dihydroorotase